MWDTVIGRHIRRANRNLFLVNTGLVLGVFAVAALSSRYLYNFAFGPFPVDSQALETNGDPGRSLEYYVTVRGDWTKPTGLQDVEQTLNKSSGKVESERVTADYVVTKVGDRLLLVKLPPNQGTPTSFSGALTTIPADARAHLGALAPAGGGGPLLPAMLDATGFRTPGFVGLAVGVPLLLLGLWNVARAVLRWSDSDRHPIARRLMRFGPPEEVAERIDNEVRTQPDTFRLGPALLTPSWLLRPTFFGLEVRHLGEVLWVYQKVTRHSVNFIPTGKSYAAVVRDRHGGTLEVVGGEKGVLQFLQEVVHRAPWVIGGYNQQLDRAWTKDRDELIAAVDERRREYLRRLSADAAE